MSPEFRNIQHSFIKCIFLSVLYMMLTFSQWFVFADIIVLTVCPRILYTAPIISEWSRLDRDLTQRNYHARRCFSWVRWIVAVTVDPVPHGCKLHTTTCMYDIVFDEYHRLLQVISWIKQFYPSLCPWYGWHFLFNLPLISSEWPAIWTKYGLLFSANVI